MTKHTRLMNSIQKHEGLKLKVYTCPAGKQTIGYGRNLEDNGISKYEALQMLDNDIKKIKSELDMELQLLDIDFYILPDHVQNVLIEMAYQMGVYGLLKFKNTILYIKNSQYDLASKEMLISQWAVQTPKRAKTLSNLMKGGY